MALEDVANERAKIAAALCAELVHRVRAKHPITFKLRFGEELVRGAIGIPKPTRILRTASPRSVALADDVSFSMENKCGGLRISVYQGNGNPSILPARIALDENTPNAVCLRNHWDHHHSKQTHDSIKGEPIGIARRRAHARSRLLQQTFA